MTFTDAEHGANYLCNLGLNADAISDPAYSGYSYVVRVARDGCEPILLGERALAEAICACGGRAR